MSRKAFFAAHCTHRFDPLHWGRLSEKSNIPQCESRIRFWPCIRGTEFQSREDFSDSLGALELSYRRCRVRKIFFHVREGNSIRTRSSVRTGNSVRAGNSVRMRR